MDSADVIASMQNVLNTFRLPAVQVAEIAGDVITVRCPPEWAAAQRGKHLRRAQEVLRERWHRGFRIQLEPSADMNSMRRLRGIVDIESV